MLDYQQHDNGNDSVVRESSQESGEDAAEYAMSPPPRLRRDTTNTTMQDILSLLVGSSSADSERNFLTNMSLVNYLKQEEVISSQNVLEAMKLCDRGIFIPRENSNQAFIDSPLRVSSYHINISAPHMHGSMLERLNVQSGDSVLDVGAGCGIVSAYLSVLVGKQGRVVGIEIKDQVLKLATSNMETLKKEKTMYTDAACDVEISKQNAFLPSNLYGCFDKVYVGASCPDERIVSLLNYLKPQGGCLIVPISLDRFTEMRLVVKQPNKDLQYQKFEQVAFSQLEIPCDAEIVLKSMEFEKTRSAKIQIPPSTFRSDSLVIRKSSMSYSPDERYGFGSLKRSQQEKKDYDQHHSISINSERSLNYKVNTSDKCSSISNSATQILTDHIKGGCNSGSYYTVANLNIHSNKVSIAQTVEGSSPQSVVSCQNGEDMEMFPSDIQDDGDLVKALGPHDYTLKGSNFSLLAHRSVLRQRCELFRARFESGMRDADLDIFEVPDNFSLAVSQQFMEYLYYDEARLQIDTELAFQLLHVATYYGVPRLIVLCEQILAEELGQVEDNVGAEAAVEMLQLADENGLKHLKNSVLSYIVFNFEKVSKTAKYSQLSLDQIRTIAIQQNIMFSRQTEILKDLCYKTTQN